MAGTTIKVEGTEQAIKDIKATELRKRGQVAKAIAITAIQGHRHMVKTLSHPGRGNWYGTHRASKPGDPPAVDTGTYRASWHPRVDPGGMGGEVYTNDHRAHVLEYGHPRWKVQPSARPHAGPVSELMRGDFVRNMKDQLGEGTT